MSSPELADLIARAEELGLHVPNCMMLAVMGCDDSLEEIVAPIVYRALTEALMGWIGEAGA